MSYFLLSDFPLAAFRFGLSILESCTRLVWEFRDFPFLNLSEADTFRDFAFPVFRFGVWFWNFDIFHVWDFLKHFQQYISCFEISHFQLSDLGFPFGRVALSMSERFTGLNCYVSLLSDIFCLPHFTFPADVFPSWFHCILDFFISYDWFHEISTFQDYIFRTKVIIDIMLE